MGPFYVSLSHSTSALVCAPPRPTEGERLAAASSSWLWPHHRPLSRRLYRFSPLLTWLKQLKSFRLPYRCPSARESNKTKAGHADIPGGGNEAEARSWDATLFSVTSWSLWVPSMTSYVLCLCLLNYFISSPSAARLPFMTYRTKFGWQGQPLFRRKTKTSNVFPHIFFIH